MICSSSSQPTPSHHPMMIDLSSAQAVAQNHYQQQAAAVAAAAHHQEQQQHHQQHAQQLAQHQSMQHQAANCPVMDYYTCSVSKVHEVRIWNMRWRILTYVSILVIPRSGKPTIQVMEAQESISWVVILSMEGRYPTLCAIR